MLKITFLWSWTCLKNQWNSSEQSVELTQKLTIEATVPHSQYSYVVTIVGYYYAVIIEGL